MGSYKKMKFGQAKKMMQGNLKGTASKVGVLLEAESKARAPVDTGHLRRSIMYDTDVSNNKATVFVGSHTEYDPAVELGIGQNAQPHHVPAITENVSKINSIIKKGMSVK